MMRNSSPVRASQRRAVPPLLTEAMRRPRRVAAKSPVGRVVGHPPERTARRVASEDPSGSATAPHAAGRDEDERGRGPEDRGAARFVPGRSAAAPAPVGVALERVAIPGCRRVAAAVAPAACAAARAAAGRTESSAVGPRVCAGDAHALTCLARLLRRADGARTIIDALAAGAVRSRSAADAGARRLLAVAARRIARLSGAARLARAARDAHALIAYLARRAAHAGGQMMPSQGALHRPMTQTCPEGHVTLAHFGSTQWPSLEHVSVGAHWNSPFWQLCTQVPMSHT
jgi:hypothetical protein